jgi:Na+-driven multidrug efflux pump
MALLIGFLVGLVLGLGLFSIGKPLLRLYVSDDALALDYGMIRMQYILAIYFVAGINSVLGTAIQSFGYSILNMTNSVFSVLILRVFWMLFIYPRYETLHCLYFCYTVSWILILLINVGMVIAILPRKLKKMYAEINTEPTLQN